MIPETPEKTTLGSYYEFRQGGKDDLIEDDRGMLHYKNYAWIIMNYDDKTWEFKTGDWEQGELYLEPAVPGHE